MMETVADKLLTNMPILSAGARPYRRTVHDRSLDSRNIDVVVSAKKRRIANGRRPACCFGKEGPDSRVVEVRKNLPPTPSGHGSQSEQILGFGKRGRHSFGSSLSTV